MEKATVESHYKNCSKGNLVICCIVPVGAGPYKVQELKGGDAVLVRNAYYWDSANTKAEKIIFSFITELEDAANQMVEGNIDIIDE